MGFNGIGMTELIIVLVIAIIVLGPKRLPEAGRSLGRGMREFKSAVTGDNDNDRIDEHDEDAKPALAAANADEPAERERAPAAA